MTVKGLNTVVVNLYFLSPSSDCYHINMCAPVASSTGGNVATVVGVAECVGVGETKDDSPTVFPLSILGQS